MAQIIFEAEVTEFQSMPVKHNTINAFSINENSMVISFCDSNNNVNAQSEISIEDAKKLARLILL